MTDVTQQDSKKYGRPDDERVIDFMKIALPAAILSIVLTIGSLFFIFTKGLNLGFQLTKLMWWVDKSAMNSTFAQRVLWL